MLEQDLKEELKKYTLVYHYRDVHGHWCWVLGASSDDVFVEIVEDFIERYVDDLEKEQFINDLIEDPDGDPYEFWDYFYNNTDYMDFNWVYVEKPKTIKPVWGVDDYDFGDQELTIIEK